VAWAQCPEKGSTTDPNHSANFDWRTSGFDVNSGFINFTRVNSPFYQDDNAVLSHFFENKDMQYEDGWELIKYDFGFDASGNPRNPPAGFIYFILYNKYTSVLRVLANGDRQGFNGAHIRLSFNKWTTDYYSSALSNASEIFALDKFETDPKIDALAEYRNYLAQWFYADFPIAYDPCTCLYESTMQVEIRLISTAEVNLSGSINADIATNVGGRGSVKESGFSVKQIVEGGEKASKSYKTVNEFVGELNNVSDAEAVNSLGEWLKEPNFLKAGLKAFPVIGSALELIDFFVAGGKKSSGPQTVKLMPMVLNGSVNLQGTISITDPFIDPIFYTPGSKNASSKEPYREPLYNEVLGVFNLLETPKMFIKSDYFRREEPKVIEERAYLRLRLSKDLKYVVNPASGLEIEEIFGQVILENASLPSQASYSSMLIPIGSLTNVGYEWGYDDEFIFEDNGDFEDQRTLGCGRSIPNFNGISLKLFINLKRKDATENIQNVLLVMNYPVETVQNDNLTIPSSTLSCNLSNDLSRSGSISNQTTQSLGNITVSNATITSGTLSAAGEVVVNANTSIHPNTTLTAGALAGGVVNLHPATRDDITQFCTNSTFGYQSKRAVFRLADNGKEHLAEEIAEDVAPSVSIFPNPVRDILTVQYRGGASYHLRITDLYGRVVHQQHVSTAEATIDMSGYPAGLYIIEVTTPDGQRWLEKVLKE